MDNRRVLIVLPNLNPGGAERLNLDLVQPLRSQGIDADLFSLIDTGILRAEAEARQFRLFRGGPDLPGIPGRLLGHLVGTVRLARIGRRYDVLVAGLEMITPFAVLAAAAVCRRPAVSQLHSMPRALYEQLGAKGRTFAILTRLFYRRFNWNTAVTDAAGEELASLGVPRATIRTVPNGIDFVRIEELAAEDLPGLGDDLPLVVAAGRLAPEKAYEVLIDAHRLARERVPHRLKIFGQGPERERLEALIRELGLEDSAVLAGYIPNHYPWIRSASLLCLSSYHEGMPLVLIEALSLGTPVVATRCSEGVASLLQEGELGALVEPGSPAALAEAIVSHLQRPEEMAARAARAGESAREAWSIETCAARHAEIIESAMRR
jgi:glycosyltransferase involved in cell wall biosynthesis